MYRKLLTGLFVLITCLLNSTLAQQNELYHADAFKTHPRLLLAKGEERALIRSCQSGNLLKKVNSAILSESDRILHQPLLQRIQTGKRLLEVSRVFLRRIYFLAYAYRVTSEKKYLVRAEREMLAVAAFSDWNPSHFLDVAEMTMGMAIGYDWLFNELPDSSRQHIRESIIKKGIEPSLDDRYNTFLKTGGNWNQVCNAGMAFGAIAVYESDPSLAAMVINRAIETIVLPMKEAYEPDGAYPEGYTYWGYGTSFNVMLLGALEKLSGKPHPLAAANGFLKTPYYYLHMTGNAGQCFNYSDARLDKTVQPAMFWFAAKLKDASLLWVEKERVALNSTRRLAGERLLPSLILWGSQLEETQMKAPKSNYWAGKGKSPVALMRTAWGKNAVFAGIKGGMASVSHAHMDIGSFVMESDGVRWSVDPGMQEYETLESKGLNIFAKGPSSDRWKVFRNTNYIHSTLTINDTLQVLNGFGELIHQSDAPSFPYAVVDLTRVYAPAVKKAERGIAITAQQQVIVKDKLETGNKPTKLRWAMLTQAKVTIVNNTTATLIQEGKKLTIKVQGKGIALKTWSAAPPRDYDEPNPGMVLIGFEYTAPANSAQEWQVCLIPGSSDKTMVIPEKWPAWE